jgi:hypothetical protein
MARRSEDERWSHIEGERGVNRIRVYERQPGGPIHVEWYDRAGRHQSSLTTITGLPIRDRKLAVQLARKLARAQAKKRTRTELQDFLNKLDKTLDEA